MERKYPPKNNDPDFILHKARYIFASPWCRNKKVLDVACGTGYGASIFVRRGAKNVTGVDIDKKTILSARKNYHDPALEFVQSDIFKLKLAEKSFEVITSFETIEHTFEPEMFLSKLVSLLSDSGCLIISTPNKKALLPGMMNFSPFHARELDFKEFNAFLRSQFEEIDYYYQEYPTAWGRLLIRLKMIGFNYLPQYEKVWIKRIMCRVFFVPLKMAAKIKDVFYTEKQALPKKFNINTSDQYCVIIAVCKRKV